MSDGRLTKLQPDHEHPVTEGFACHKGLAAVALRTLGALELDLQTLHRVRQRLVSVRRTLLNQLRAILFERGHAFPQGTLENNGEFTFSNWSDLIREGAGGPDWVVVIDDAGAGYAAPGR